MHIRTPSRSLRRDLEKRFKKKWRKDREKRERQERGEDISDDENNSGHEKRKDRNRKRRREDEDGEDVGHHDLRRKEKDQEVKYTSQVPNLVAAALHDVQQPNST